MLLPEEAGIAPLPLVRQTRQKMAALPPWRAAVLRPPLAPTNQTMRAGRGPQDKRDTTSRTLPHEPGKPPASGESLRVLRKEVSFDLRRMLALRTPRFCFDIHAILCQTPRLWQLGGHDGLASARLIPLPSWRDSDRGGSWLRSLSQLRCAFLQSGPQLQPCRYFNPQAAQVVCPDVPLYRLVHDAGKMNYNKFLDRANKETTWARCDTVVGKLL